MSDTRRTKRDQYLTPFDTCQVSFDAPMKMPDDISDKALLALNLRVARESAHLTQAQAGAAVGRSRQTVNLWESAESPTKPDEEMLQQLAKVYGVPARSLRYDRFGITHDPRPHMMPDEEEAFAQKMRDAFHPALEILAMDFEDEVRSTGVDREFLWFVRAVMREPALMAMFAGGYDAKPMSLDEQKEEFASVIAALRTLLVRRLKRVGALRPVRSMTPADLEPLPKSEESPRRREGDG